MQIEYKTTVWRKMNVPDHLSEDEVIQIIKDNHENANEIFDELYAVNFDPCDEAIDNTEDLLTPADNDDQATMILKDDDDNEIWTNEPEKTEREIASKLINTDVLYLDHTDLADRTRDYLIEEITPDHLKDRDSFRKAQVVILTMENQGSKLLKIRF